MEFAKTGFYHKLHHFAFFRCDNDIFFCSAGDALVKKGISCKAFLNSCRADLGLRGGGKDISAQGVIEKKQKGFLEHVTEAFSKFVSKK